MHTYIHNTYIHTYIIHKCIHTYIHQIIANNCKRTLEGRNKVLIRMYIRYSENTQEWSVHHIRIARTIHGI